MELMTGLIEAHIFRQINGKMEFLLLKRSENEIYPGIWQMVSGKIKKGEKAYEAALREISEETGLIPVKFWAAPNVSSFYDQEKDCILFLPVFAAMVDSKAGVIISKEHTAYSWVSQEEAVKLLAWPGQRKSVEYISQYFLKEHEFLKFTEIKI